MASRAIPVRLGLTAGRRAVPADVLLFVVAFAARAGILYAQNGSVFDGTGYDPGVYYGAADALVHGLAPYRDFTLLHPPGMTLALAPFALLGTLTTDRIGFEAATIASLLAGAANAVLVARIARRADLRPGAAAAGGVLYAVTILSTRSEFSGQLEVLSNFLLLLGIWAYVAGARVPARRFPALTGAALAAATSVKLWYAAPLLLVLAWHLVDRRPRRQLAWAAGSALLALVCINLPFLLLSGRSMLQLVVVDQARRRGYGLGSVLQRASDLDLVDVLRPGTSHQGALVWAVAAASVVLVAVILACRTRVGRLAAALLVVQLAVLFAAPVYYQFYPDYVIPAAAVTTAAAVHVLASARRPVLRRALTAAGWLVVGLSAAATVRVELTHPQGYDEPAPDAYLSQAVANDQCVQSNSPMPLIELDVLSRDLDNGCPQWIDVVGVAYSRDARGSVFRAKNTYYQQDVLRYLRSGQAYVLAEVKAAGIAHWVLRELDRGRVIARGDGLVLRASLRRSASRRPAGATRPAGPSAASRRRPPTTPR